MAMMASGRHRLQRRGASSLLTCFNAAAIAIAVIVSIPRKFFTHLLSLRPMRLLSLPTFGILATGNVYTASNLRMPKIIGRVRQSS
jgi:hypothetical protein